jgi:hypothetical protein
LAKKPDEKSNGFQRSLTLVAYRSTTGQIVLIHHVFRAHGRHGQSEATLLEEVRKSGALAAQVPTDQVAVLRVDPKFFQRSALYRVDPATRKIEIVDSKGSDGVASGADFRMPSV